MPSDQPQTPESPSQVSSVAAELAAKTATATSPQFAHSLPTPAHSINGSMSSHADIGMDMSQEELSNKRKRDLADNGDREQKKAHLESNNKVTKANIEDLHLEVGVKYLLCRTPHMPHPAPVREDLFARYSLNGIAQSVARTNPDGSKGVKLRKTYKNQLKDYGLSGVFNPVKKDEGPDTLLTTLRMPQEEWDSRYARGKELEMGLPDATLAQMGKAFTMSRGVVPTTLWDRSVLGEIAAPPVARAMKVTQNGNRTPLQNPSVARAVKAEPTRPKRANTKRRYGDESFEGYGEGYVDDDAQEVGYSTGGDGDDRGGSRKRPKKNGQHNFPNGAMRPNPGYGPGMVGA